MPSKKRAGNKKKGSQSNFAKLSIFQPNKYKFKKTCPLSAKGAPEVDYKNIRLLKKYMSENGKILPSRITNVSQKKHPYMLVNSAVKLVGRRIPLAPMGVRARGPV